MTPTQFDEEEWKWR